jgi:hypothetical protein
MKKILPLAALCIALSACNQNGNNALSYKYIPVKDGSKWIYLDESGKQAINTSFASAGIFSEGLALVSNDQNKYGYINEKGDYVIQPQYSGATYFSEGLAFVLSSEGYPQCIDTKGKVLFELKQADLATAFHDGLARIIMQGKTGFVDRTGKMVITPNLDEAGDFHEGMALTKKHSGDGTLYGYINKEGKVIVEPQYIFARDFSDGLGMVVDAHQKGGYINKEGKMTIEPTYTRGTEFSDKYAMVFSDQWYYLDKNGKTKGIGMYQGVNKFQNGLAGVESDHKWGYVDENGKLVIQPQFDDESNFFDNGLATVKVNGKYGIIDKKGKYVANPQYNDIFGNLQDDALTDLPANFAVISDYIDVNSLAESLLSNSDDLSFRNFNNMTTLNDIYDTYGITNMYIDGYVLKDNSEVILGPNAIISPTEYFFGMQIGSNGRIFEDVAEANPRLQGVQFDILIKDKQAELLNAIREAIRKKYSATEVASAATDDASVHQLQQKLDSQPGAQISRKYFVLYAENMGFIGTISDNEIELLVHFKK